MIGLSKETYTVEPREPVILTPYIEPIASEGEQDDNILRVKDHIGESVLLKFGDAIREVVISHLSPNEQAVYIQYTGETTGKWMTVERFSQAFFDFAPAIQTGQTA